MADLGYQRAHEYGFVGNYSGQAWLGWAGEVKSGDRDVCGNWMKSQVREWSEVLPMW